MIDVKLIEALKTAKHVIIAGHINPDGDAVGACTALALALKKQNVEPIILLEQYPETYNYLSGQQYVQNQLPPDHPVDVFVALDCADKERLGDFISYFEKAPVTINIDHHVSNPNYAEYNWVDANASSTCQVIYQLIKNMEIPIDNKIATSLYTGIIYDTGGFKHTNTSSTTHDIAGELINYGIHFSEIIDRLFYTRSYMATKLLGRAFMNLELLQEGRMAVTTLSKTEIEREGAQVSDADGIVRFIKEIQDVEVAVFLYEKNADDVKVSLRSSNGTDVCKIAKQFDGGGHAKAAGCSLKMPLLQAKQTVLDAIQKQLF